MKTKVSPVTNNEVKKEIKMDKQEFDIRTKFRNYLKVCRQIVVGRDKEITVAGVAMLTKANLMLLGSPGEGKSFLASTMVNNILNSKTFFTACSPETDMDAIFGTPIFDSLQQGRYERNLEGTLADCDFAFIDEIGKANPVLHMSMFTALNERVFVNGTSGTKKLDLISTIAASNESLSPETAGLNSRFHLKVICKRLDSEQRFELLSRRNKRIRYVFPDEYKISLEEIKLAQDYVENIELSDELLKRIVGLGEILQASTEPDSRKLEICVNLVKASCFLRMKNDPDTSDIAVLKYALWDAPEHFPDVEKLIEEFQSQPLPSGTFDPFG